MRMINGDIYMMMRLKEKASGIRVRYSVDSILQLQLNIYDSENSVSTLDRDCAGSDHDLEFLHV